MESGVKNFKIAKSLLQSLSNAKERVSDPTEKKILSTQYQILLEKNFEMLKAFHELQVTWKNNLNEKIKRQLHLVDPQISAKDEEEVLQSGVTDVFSLQMMNTSTHVRAKNLLEDVKGKHLEVLCIERTIRVLGTRLILLGTKAFVCRHELFALCARKADN